MAATIREIGVASLETQSIPSSVSTREQLLMSIRGSRVIIPDLQSMISHWPQGIHTEVARLDDYVQRTLTCLSSHSNNETRLRRLRASNIALFGASWWPYASYEALEIVTCLSIWLFAWDDETDSLEFSSVISDWDKASTFRQRTIDYLQRILSSNPESEPSNTSIDPIISLFRPVGEAISKTCNDRQVKTFLNELLFYVNMCGEEQKFQMAHRLPTVEEYVRLRLGSGAVRVCFGTIEYAYGITLPQQVMDDEAMQRIWHEANVIIYTTNDILSVKKEVVSLETSVLDPLPFSHIDTSQAQSQVDSLVPLLSLELGSVQAAINQAVDIVRSSIERFDAAEMEILERYSATPEVQEDIRKSIDGCKYACTSNLNWSLISGRYKLNCQSMKGGLHITL
ncbi:terpenoid synthase [Hypoxylon sp. FL0890]|nr:terpenoid synthase [Hypoxylon sp. FL0890]